MSEQIVARHRHEIQRLQKQWKARLLASQQEYEERVQELEDQLREERTSTEALKKRLLEMVVLSPPPRKKEKMTEREGVTWPSMGWAARVMFLHNGYCTQADKNRSAPPVLSPDHEDLTSEVRTLREYCNNLEKATQHLQVGGDWGCYFLVPST